MIRRLEMEAKEARELAPYAVKSQDSRGRRHSEKEHEFRTAFQRDRDRVLHSTAFRRLQYKTQVFVNHEGDHYRTRLTHSLEVSQIARSIGRVLRLNEDLIEAVSLAHDLGHGPFGHAGEYALSEMMAEHGGFEHNRQSLRIVEVLEDSYPEFPGLNLTREVLDGMKKHDGGALSLEGQLADLADEIAYDSHDVEDGLRSGLISEDELAPLAIWKEISGYMNKKYSGLSVAHRQRLATRLLINRQADDLVRQTHRNLERYSVVAAKDVARAGRRIVEFSPEMKQLKKSWRKFLSTRLYNHYRVVRMTEKAKRLIRNVFSVYIENPRQLPPPVLEREKRDGLYRVVCDYLAGMTDRFAQDEHKRLFEPYERV
ncbi:MAG: deoxyguanosinetriphosphate triphosphohydrolase [Candidatus Omnitrophica bacterium]|nr:deoxyguanosinetriphosphate triphosphohydrolase [Candidatus Omnitrophota bacterium]